MREPVRNAVISAIAALLICTPASAATALSCGDAGKPMQGFPPPPDKVINRSNQFASDDNVRWTLSHARMLLPTANIRRGPGAVAALPYSAKPLGPVVFNNTEGKAAGLEDWLQRTSTDGLLVMHGGRIVYEAYCDYRPSDMPHQLLSMSKSFAGLIAAMLIAEGKLDPDAPLSRYVPELAGSAWEDATVQQTLDMTTAVRYSEDTADPNSDVHRYYGVASGNLPAPAGYSGPGNLYAMLPRLPKEGEHGSGFTYKTVNVEAMTWAVSRITGKRMSELISERIWQKLGAEEDAYVTVDPVGSEMMGGGMSASLRDLGRLGEMLRLNGRFNGRQIVPAAIVAELRKGGDPEKFARDPLRKAMKGYSYHDYWWHPPGSDGVFEARGGFGQEVYVNPTTQVVIVKLSSRSLTARIDEAYDRLGFAAIDAALRKRSRHGQ